MENKIKIWGKEVERCFICAYYNGYEGCCNITGEYIDPISSDNINNKCHFLKPITKEVIEGFGFKVIKEKDGAFKADLKFEFDEFFGTWEILFSHDNYAVINKYDYGVTTYFRGIINNPIELEFILKSIGVIE